MQGSDPIYRSSDGDVVDAIVWRHYGRQDAGLVSGVLEANPGLSALGAILPAGVSIVLPPEPAAPELETVRLWG
ncbi:MAG: tail protein X [Roseovarius confluentis]|jgi:phage tail protein X